MNLDAFLHHLHFDVDQVKPLDFEVDWDDAPLPYKLYQNLPVVPLSTDIPIRLENKEHPNRPNLKELSQFLWYVYGLTHFCQSVVASDSSRSLGVMQAFRRFVPSGGGLYPNELYIYLNIEELPVGVYHYDVAHHRLVLLREGNYDSYLSRTLGRRCDLTTCFGAIFVSTMYWKNFYKYNNFSYRLQGLDTGVLLGQVLEVSKRFSYETTVYYQFLDDAIHHLLGLSEQEESIYAIVPLSIDPSSRWFTIDGTAEADSAIELCKELPGLQHSHYVRSRTILEYPLLLQINKASKLETWQAESLSRLTERLGCKQNVDDQLEASDVSLPPFDRLEYDFSEVCKKRFSPGIDFILNKINQFQIAVLLQEAMSSFTYRNDLDQGESRARSRVSLYGCLYNVEGIPDGAYRYQDSIHSLCSIQQGDHRTTLQQAMTMHNINLSQVPICLHVAGSIDPIKSALGYRGYRIQQMEAGMLVQRIVLAATALGMGGHPLLGFVAQICDELYNLAPQKRTSLIQIPVGPYRFPPRLQGTLL